MIKVTGPLEGENLAPSDFVLLYSALVLKNGWYSYAFDNLQKKSLDWALQQETNSFNLPINEDENKIDLTSGMNRVAFFGFLSLDNYYRSGSVIISMQEKEADDIINMYSQHTNVEEVRKLADYLRPPTGERRRRRAAESTMSDSDSDGPKSGSDTPLHRV